MAVNRFRAFLWQLSGNNTGTVWVLKCDIRKFFDSVSHDILLGECRKRISDRRVIELLAGVVGSFETSTGKGIPLGNVTSQLFSNVYLHLLDEFIKRELRVIYYIRYADDFVIATNTRSELEPLTARLRSFLKEHLSLTLHEDKVFVRKWHQGVDFLGYVLYPHYTVLRNNTKRRILSTFTRQAQKCHSGEVTKERLDQTRQSYLGILRHCKGAKVRSGLNALYRSV